MRRLLARLAAARKRPDLSGVIAARLRAEQDDVIERWAANLGRVDFDWLHTTSKDRR